MNVLGVFGFCCAAVLLGPPAFAQEAEEAGRQATELSQEGDRLSESGNDREASERYQRAFALVPLPSFALRGAQSLARGGRLLEAEALYVEAARVALPESAPPQEVAAQAQAEAERAKLAARIPGVVIAIEGARPEEVRVTIDDAPIVLSPPNARHPVNPGRIRIEGSRGGTAIEKRLTLVEGETATVKLVFDATPGSAPAPRGVQDGGAPAAAPAEAELGPVEAPGGRGQRLVGYVTLGVGGASLLTGGVFGLLALKDQSDLRARCPLARCPGALESDVDAYESKKTIATAGLVSGAGLVLGGAILILTAPSGRAEPRAEARIGGFFDGRAGGLWGRF